MGPRQQNSFEKPSLLRSNESLFSAKQKNFSATKSVALFSRETSFVPVTDRQRGSFFFKQKLSNIGWHACISEQHWMPCALYLAGIVGYGADSVVC